MLTKRKNSRAASIALHAVRTDEQREPLNFDAVFDRYAAYVGAVLLRITGDETMVDDLVQDVFLDCYQKFGKIDSWEHARRWLVKVAVRKAGRRLRRQKLVQFLSLSDPACPELGASLTTADERAELTMLYQLLEKLPIGIRMAWVLRYMEGARLSEVAFACGCSLATAKRRIRTAQQFINGEIALDDPGVGR